MSEHIEPQLGADAFSCPHCGAVANQDWYSLFLKPEQAGDIGVLTPEAVNATDDATKEMSRLIERLRNNELTYQYQKHPTPLKVKMANLYVSNCHGCHGFSLWVGGLLVFPTRLDKSPEFAEEEVAEAAAVFDSFPRGATALMRLCIQKMVPLLLENGKALDQRVSSLVRKGLEMEMQEAKEVFQYFRANPTQLSHLEPPGDKQTALRFLDSLQAVLERRMPQSEEQK